MGVGNRRGRGPCCDHASSTRQAAVRAEAVSISPTSATAESWACESHAPSARLRACAWAHERGYFPDLPGLRPGDHPFPTPDALQCLKFAMLRVGLGGLCQ